MLAMTDAVGKFKILEHDWFIDELLPEEAAAAVSVISDQYRVQSVRKRDASKLSTIQRLLVSIFKYCRGIRSSGGPVLKANQGQIGPGPSIGEEVRHRLDFVYNTRNCRALVPIVVEIFFNETL